MHQNPTKPDRDLLPALSSGSSCWPPARTPSSRSDAHEAQHHRSVRVAARAKAPTRPSWDISTWDLTNRTSSVPLKTPIEQVVSARPKMCPCTGRFWNDAESTWPNTQQHLSSGTTLGMLSSPAPFPPRVPVPSPSTSHSPHRPCSSLLDSPENEVEKLDRWP